MPKYWGETNVQPRESPRSGSKTKYVEERKRERLKVGNNNGQLRNANATSGGACKLPGPICFLLNHKKLIHCPGKP